MKIQHTVLLVVIAIGLMLFVRFPAKGQPTEGGPQLVFLGEGFPKGGIQRVWRLYCDRSRGNLLYVAGAQDAVAVVPGGCEKN